MTKLFLKCILLLAPIGVIIACVNYYGDPGHMFGKAVIEEGICTIMLKGKNVVNHPSDINYRTLKSRYLEEMEESNQVIVLGSSRTLGVSRRNTGEQNLFNTWVSAANLTDYMAIYQLLRENNKLPKQIIMGVDPWVIDDSRGRNHNQRPDRLFEIRYNEIAGEIGTKKNNLFSVRNYIGNLISVDLINLFSLGYFSSSMERVLNGETTAEINYSAIDGVEEEGAILMTDGSLIFPKAFREAHQDSVDALALEYTEEYVGKEIRLSKTNQEMFENFIALLQADGIETILFLTPYHPLTYETMMKHSSSLSEVETYLQELAKGENIALIGSYNPGKIGIGAEDMLDHYHVREHVVTNLLKLR